MKFSILWILFVTAWVGVAIALYSWQIGDVDWLVIWDGFRGAPNPYPKSMDLSVWHVGAVARVLVGIFMAIVLFGSMVTAIQIAFDKKGQ